MTKFGIALGMVQLLQKCPEPRRIDKNNIDQEKGCQGQKKDDKVNEHNTDGQKNSNAEAHGSLL